MPTHSLPRGTDVIEGLARLGRALGYFAEKECPVERRRNNPPAVDVAWLRESNQKYPLMIFEIESRASNAAANNPVKVFGQPNERFEKPLFFFHVFINAGTETTRIENLRRLFGTHNYRAYRLDEEGPANLIKDILAQHRRLRRRLELAPLFDEIGTAVWQGVELSDLLGHIEGLKFSANFLAEYAARAVEEPMYRPEYLRLLSKTIDFPTERRKVGTYNTYIGWHWSEPIHIGLLALNDPADGNWLARLREWQERSSFMSQIGPHFGLSADYDDFVLGLAPVLWALVAALMCKVEAAGSYIIDQLLDVLDAVANADPEDSFFPAIWALHIAASAGDVSRYDQVQAFINEREGISTTALFQPPSIVNVGERDEEWASAIADRREPVPTYDEFRRALPPSRITADELKNRLIETALIVLTRESAIQEWSQPVVELLRYSSSTSREA